MRDKIEGLKEVDEQLWRVYARGYTGKIEGLIFRNHNIITELPKEAEFIACGMDFGFTNDPTTLIEVYRYNGELILNELLFSTGLTNQDIGNRLTQLGFNKQKIIIADSAEPKSIEELRRMGFNVQPASKGADSIRASIDILKRFTLNITSNSTNLKKEFMNYKWDEKDNTKPIDCFNHGIDAVRYVALNKLANKNTGSYNFA
jgi:phage terminase large subunit